MPSGEHTDAFGNVNANPVSKLEELVDSFNAEQHRPAIILGHSTDDAFMQGLIPSDSLPAHGYIEGLSLDEDGTLIAHASLQPEAQDWIERGLYDYRSIALYSADSPYNPTPGKASVRHLALLGASPPAIKGLTPLKDILSTNEAYGEVMTLAKTKEPEAFEEAEEEVLPEVEASEAPVEEEVAVKEADSEEAEAPEAPEADAGAFLEGNAGEFIRFILTDGEEGYQGEVTRFEPEPSAENSYLYDGAGKFMGSFVDESLGEPETFDFELMQSGDAWSISFKPSGTEDEGNEEPEPEAEEPEASGEKPKPYMEEKPAEEELEEEQPVTAFSEPEPTPDQLRIKQLEAKLAEIELKELSTFIAGVYGEGKLIEGQFAQADCLALAMAVRAIPAPEAYSESHKTALDAFKGFLSGLPPQIAYGDSPLAAPEVAESDAASPPIAPHGAVYSEDGLAALTRIQAYCEEHSLDITKPNQFKQAARAVAMEKS